MTRRRVKFPYPFDKLFNINVRGTLFTVQKALPLLNDGGSIILNGSVASVKGSAAFGVYAASKAAIRSFVRTWTIDLKDRRIRPNVVSPGPIKPSPFFKGSSMSARTPLALDRSVRGYPLERNGFPPQLLRSDCAMSGKTHAVGPLISHLVLH